MRIQYFKKLAESFSKIDTPEREVRVLKHVDSEDYEVDPSNRIYILDNTGLYPSLSYAGNPEEHKIYQCLPTHVSSVLVMRTGGKVAGGYSIEAYRDLEEKMTMSKEPLGAFYESLARKMETLFGDPLVIKGILHDRKIFYVMEVYPEIISENYDSRNIFIDYSELLMSGSAEIETTLRKLCHYSEIVSHSPEMAQVPDQMLSESSKYLVEHVPITSYVGSWEDKFIEYGNGSFYRQSAPRAIVVKKAEDIPKEEPKADKLIFLLDRGTSASINFYRDAYQEIVRNSLDWKNPLRNIDIYVRDISSFEELRYLNGVFNTVIDEQRTYGVKSIGRNPVTGILCSNYRQISKISHLANFVSNFIIDIFPIKLDGINVSLRDISGIEADDLDLDFISKCIDGVSANIGAFILEGKGRFTFQYLLEISKVFDFLVVSSEVDYNNALVALASAKSAGHFRNREDFDIEIWR